MPDAVVIGAGPNGLVAANLLAEKGWSIEVLEAQPDPGGAVRSDRGVHPDYVSDLFSAFDPLAAASPVLAGLELQEEGLSWSRAPRVLAHPLPDGRCAVLERRAEETAAGLDSFAAGDGAAWLDLCATWNRFGPDILGALFTPFPPVRSSVRLAARLRAAGGLRLARTLLLPARRLGEEQFRGEAGRLLLAGNALHADLGPEAAGSGGFGQLGDQAVPAAQTPACPRKRRRACAGSSATGPMCSGTVHGLLDVVAVKALILRVLRDRFLQIALEISPSPPCGLVGRRLRFAPRLSGRRPQSLAQFHDAIVRLVRRAPHADQLFDGVCHARTLERYGRARPRGPGRVEVVAVAERRSRCGGVRPGRARG